MATKAAYYLVLNSPWAYLGSARFAGLIDRYRPDFTIATVNIGNIFEQTGGLPLPKRSPQRQAYRLAELKRWHDHLGVPIVLQPKNFPCDERLGALAVHALAKEPRKALAFANAAQAMLWAEDRSLADRGVLAEAAARAGLDGRTLLAEVDANAAALDQRRTDATAEALQRGVFGVPAYIVGDELFWGQDRLEFVARALARP